MKTTADGRETAMFSVGDIAKLQSERHIWRKK